MPNKLLIKANFCDLRNVKEETLAAYDVIEVRANVVVLNDRARELIARYPVTLKCDLATDNPNIALRSVNGVAEVTPGDVPEADTVLTVNGELKIASGSAEVLARYLQITVNGQVYCPRSLSGKLGNVAVNGQIITWPDGAVQLKNTAVLDSTFALRAKPALYWAARCVVMLDPALDVAALAKQGVRFDTPRAILAQSLATQAAPLFEDDTDLEIVPDGTAYLKDDAELTAALIRRKGNKLYVDGRLTLTAESAALLPQLEYCKVTGTALVPAAQEKAFSASCVQAEKVQTVRGVVLQCLGGREVYFWREGSYGWQTVAGPGQGTGGLLDAGGPGRPLRKRVRHGGADPGTGTGTDCRKADAVGMRHGTVHRRTKRCCAAGSQRCGRYLRRQRQAH